MCRAKRKSLGAWDELNPTNQLLGPRCGGPLEGEGNKRAGTESTYPYYPGNCSLLGGWVYEECA